MKRSYALKTKSEAKLTWIRICTFLRSLTLGFIHDNAAAFEAYSRNATPFGGNWAPSVPCNTTTTLEKQLTAVQQQLDQINADLLALTGNLEVNRQFVGRSGNTTLMDRPIDRLPVRVRKSVVGINRHYERPIERRVQG